MTDGTRRQGERSVAALALLAGVGAVAIAMAVGLAPDVLELAATPPLIVRAALSGLAIVVGGRLLFAAIQRIDSSMRREPGAIGQISNADLGTMVRGVRLVFLAAASFTAAAGWILGEPLPLVIALVIAGVDVVETSFMLLVASPSGGRN
jgi:hypothetical protein